MPLKGASREIVPLGRGGGGTPGAALAMSQGRGRTAWGLAQFVSLDAWGNYDSMCFTFSKAQSFLSSFPPPSHISGVPAAGSARKCPVDAVSR